MCLEPLLPSSQTTKLVCGHEYHQECVSSLRTLGVNGLCPQCREPFAADDIYFKACRQIVCRDRLTDKKQRRALLDEAGQLLNRALLENPEHARSHYTLGVVLDKQGDLVSAISSFQRGIAIDPHFMKAHINLGLAQERRGDYQAAIVAYTSGRDASEAKACQAFQRCIDRCELLAGFSTAPLEALLPTAPLLRSVSAPSSSAEQPRTSVTAAASPPAKPRSAAQKENVRQQLQRIKDMYATNQQKQQKQQEAAAAARLGAAETPPPGGEAAVGDAATYSGGGSAGHCPGSD
jgi:tetratricopeptide (TPR) repeat protein